LILLKGDDDRHRPPMVLKYNGLIGTFHLFDG
jgi:hypothetical protein